jgi:UDP-glucose 4-epimerase
LKNILITGGAGYIGSHVVNLLRKGPYNIIIYDNLSTGRKESVTGGKLVVGDLEDENTLEELMKAYQFEAIFHFAGSIVVPESVRDPLKYYSNNTENTLRLIKLCLKHNINNFIFSSTACVYGRTGDGFYGEQTPTNPMNPYGKTKLMTEWMLEDTTRAHPHFRFAILRYFNVAGASIDGLIGQCSPLSTHLIKVACETVIGKRSSMSIFGEDYPTKDGTCVRDYIHIDDLAQAHLNSLEYLLNQGPSEIFNCGYGRGYTVKEVLQTMEKVSGISFNIEKGQRREGDPPILIAKSDKIKSLLNWKPRYDNLQTIVKTALDWEMKLRQRDLS